MRMEFYELLRCADDAHSVPGGSVHPGWMVVAGTRWVCQNRRVLQIGLIAWRFRGVGQSPDAPEHSPPPPPAYQPLCSHPHPPAAVPAVDAHTRVSQKAVAWAVTHAMAAMANSGHARESFRTRWYLRILDTRFPANSPAIRSSAMSGRPKSMPQSPETRRPCPFARVAGEQACPSSALELGSGRVASRVRGGPPGSLRGRLG